MTHNTADVVHTKNWSTKNEKLERNQGVIIIRKSCNVPRACKCQDCQVRRILYDVVKCSSDVV